MPRHLQAAVLAWRIGSEAPPLGAAAAAAAGKRPGSGLQLVRGDDGGGAATWGDGDGSDAAAAGGGGMFSFGGTTEVHQLSTTSIVGETKRRAMAHVPRSHSCLCFSQASI